MYRFEKPRIENPPAIFWPLLALGIIMAAEASVALVTGVWEWSSGGAMGFYIAAPIAALLVGVPAWYRFIIVPGIVTVKRGVLLSIGISIVAHPVMWLLLTLLANFASFSFDMGANMLENVPVYIIFSWLYGGWATTFMAVFFGVLLVGLQIVLIRARRHFAYQTPETIHRRRMSQLETSQQDR